MAVWVLYKGNICCFTADHPSFFISKEVEVAWTQTKLAGPKSRLKWVLNSGILEIFHRAIFEKYKSWKFCLIFPGFEPGIFSLWVQHLIHWATRARGWAKKEYRYKASTKIDDSSGLFHVFTMVQNQHENRAKTFSVKVFVSLVF